MPLDHTPAQWREGVVSPPSPAARAVAVVVAAGAAVWVSRGSSSEDIVNPHRIVTATELPVEASTGHGFCLLGIPVAVGMCCP